MRKKLYLVLVSFCFVFASVFAQERNCATMEYFETQLQNDPSIEQKMTEIETFTQNYIQNAPNLSVNAEILYVPLVVHIVWNSANPVENISDAQIMSQIDVIYKDFRRLNEDADDTWPQAADMEIEFYLAQQDPDGNPTNGITRTETTVASWGTSDNIKFSSSGGVDAWDPTRYFNFWVGNIGGGILGYATFPTSAGDPNDGIVMSPQYFGSSDYEAAAGETFYLSAPYDKGRTTTHEMGHYFNLFHIWGDDGSACSGSDLVDDTPNQGGSTFGCPSGVLTDACATTDPGFMYQNYMDYTDDGCMNLFTEGQKERMRATLAPGGPRDQLNQPLDYSMTLTSSEVDVCSPADAVFEFTYNTYDDFADSTTFSTVGLPAGTTGVFSPTSATTDGTVVTLTVSGIGSVAVGGYPFTIEGTSGDILRTADATFNVYDSGLAAPTLSAPADGATDTVTDMDFEWVEDANAASYDIDIATDAGFTTIVYSQNVDTNQYTQDGLMPLTDYWWRVRSVNDCGTGDYSSASFSTANIVCDNYDSTDTPIAIPDASGAGINSVINVGTTSLITDVNVTVDLSHTWDSDMIITLTSPAGISVILSNRNGGSGDNYTNTVFDQEAATSITAGTAPFTGSFQPEEDMSVLYGEFSGGDWTLNVSDNASFDTGTINSWSIEICGVPQLDNDGDGVPNDSDNCPDTANAGQEDMDLDGIGDVCDDDRDGDGVLNVDDNCPDRPNADQADADTDGIGDVCDIECGSFTAIDTPIAISTTGNVTYNSVINSSDDLEIDDINVTINIDHTWASDLDIFLQSPSGTVVELTTDNGGSGDNYTDTVFDDDAATSITAGSAPFTGAFQPEGTLADFIGESTLGDWTLVVTDDAGGDGGIINLFEIEFCVVGEFSVDTDGDGVIDDADNCPDTANADQADMDNDGIGDVCDDDIDGDGFINEDDNCPENANPEQTDYDNDGIGDLCDEECETSTSTDTPIEIASSGDDATYLVTTQIMENVIITDVNVTINIDHDWDSDLDIYLISPDGVEVELSTGNGGSGDNYTDTVFDQEADTFIISGSPPFTGSFIPEGDLSVLYGGLAFGEWTLSVSDTFGAFDGGMINDFTLEVCGVRDPFDYDSDGVLNEDDNCFETVNPDQSDLDGDGQGDACDDDIDGDGVLNESDNCVLTANSDQSDIDGDGLGDVCDDDIDGDGVLNEEDNCPETENPMQYDMNVNGIGDVCDGLIVNDVLSPNGDGINDTWMIMNMDRYPNARINVFNRWGNEVFSSSSYNNDWRGTSDSSGGNTLPSGSYFYQIDQNGDGSLILSGWIYLTKE